ncbi:hypothetical protein [Kitasatospora sp. LaBMicrA B282]|uniref:hypothetical protein n=1 Tax=Kitasatospora sp. LaBMicrA B282 TaxID=3420949 RepID=UPI003D13BA43
MSNGIDLQVKSSSVSRRTSLDALLTASTVGVWGPDLTSGPVPACQQGPGPCDSPRCYPGRY